MLTSLSLCPPDYSFHSDIRRIDWMSSRISHARGDDHVLTIDFQDLVMPTRSLAIYSDLKPLACSFLLVSLSHISTWLSSRHEYQIINMRARGFLHEGVFSLHHYIDINIRDVNHGWFSVHQVATNRKISKLTTRTEAHE